MNTINLNPDNIIKLLSSLVLFLAALTGYLLLIWRGRRRTKAAIKSDSDSFFLLQRAQQLRLALSKPLHSEFRVVALLLLEDGSIILGANDEASPSMGGAICAERAAFLQYRVQEPGMRRLKKKVTTVYIVTDADKPVPPGTLCREYMYGHPATSPIITRVVMQSADTESQPWILTLGELYPFPSIYAGLRVEEQLAMGLKYGETLLLHEAAALDIMDLPRNDMDRLLEAAHEASLKDDRKDLHGIAYGAAAAIQRKNLSDRIQIVAASQRKALEYGATQDAICQLAPSLLSPDTARVLAIVQVDQSRIPHAPFAPARSLLVEHGLGNCPIILTVKDEEGRLSVRSVLAKELAPYVPEFR